MKQKDFYKLAEIVKENMKLANNCETIDAKHESLSMAIVIGQDIYQLAQKELFDMTVDEANNFRETFYDVSGINEAFSIMDGE